MSLEKLTFSDKIVQLKRVLLYTIPEEFPGQMPSILRNFANARLDYKVEDHHMQQAFNELYEEGRLTEKPDLSVSVLKRVRKTRRATYLN